MTTVIIVGKAHNTVKNLMRSHLIRLSKASPLATRKQVIKRFITGYMSPRAPPLRYVKSRKNFVSSGVKFPL